MTKTAKIHHATAAAAEKNGVELKPLKEGFVALHSKTNKKASAASAKEALAKVLTLVKGGNDEESEDEGTDEGRVVVKEKYKKKYKPNGGNCGDNLAKVLTAYRAKGATSEKAFAAVARENKIEPTRWSGRNQGLQWMALSNVLRNRVRKKETVLVDGVAVTKL